MIKHSKYKNKDSLVLESSKIRAEIIPNPGGKVASLINKQTGYEYMLQRPSSTYKDQPFGGNYVEGECSGFDDMFPTIDECLYLDHPWEGIKMMDHGEVWSLPWEYELSNEKLSLEVLGVNFPYKLRKQLSFQDENTLLVDYRLTNLGETSFEFLWAGHMMINIEEGTKLNVPEDCKQAVRILTNGKGKFGDTHEWPFILGDNGRYRADISRAEITKGFEKYYFTNQLAKGWCNLAYPDQNNSLTIEFSERSVPYLGILMNENGWDNIYNIIIEPCTISYDRPDVAREYGQVSKVDAGEQYDWFVKLKV